MRPHLTEHCRRMLDIERQHSDRVVIKKSITIFSEDVLLIRKQGKVIIAAITLDVHDPNKKSVQTEAALIFHDPPDDRIIQQFVLLFERADKYGTAIKNITQAGEITC